MDSRFPRTGSWCPRRGHPVRTWSWGGRSIGRAPATADCVELFRLPLGSVSRFATLAGTSPETSLAFSPDGSRLAIGSHAGDLLVVDAWTGQIRARRHLAEAMVREVAWALDGRFVFAAEQSPDAFVYQLRPDDLGEIGRVRLADHVGTSAPPPGDDLYGAFTLPTAHSLLPLPGGDVIVAATHGWQTSEGRRNASRLLRLSGPDLRIAAAWPEVGPADAVFRAFTGSAEHVAMALGRTASGPPPDLPLHGVMVLRSDDFATSRVIHLDPLKPWFATPFVLDRVAMQDARGPVVLALADGRIHASDTQGADFYVDLGAPILVDDVPIAARVSNIELVDGVVYAISSRTTIPWGAASPELRPPTTHPSENAVWALGLGEGALPLLWTWRGPHELVGLSVSPDGRWAVVGAGRREHDRRLDLFGALVFRLDGEGSGPERMRAFCETRSPVFHRHALAPDGRIAVVEIPWTHSDEVHGTYAVTVFR